MIKVSVLMATYKSNKFFLEEAINSILNQTYTNFELILVIDGDDPVADKVLSEYSDERMIILRNQDNIGLTKSLNKGLKYCKGKYIVRMDSDDISISTRLEQQVSFMEKNEHVVACGSYSINTLSSRLLKSYTSNIPELLKVRMFFINAGIAHPTAIIRSEVLFSNRLKYDERLLKSQDYDLWVRLLEYGEVKILPKVLLIYRVHDEQISRNKNEIDYYTSLTRERQIEKLGIPLSTRQIEILNSFSTKDIIGDKYEHENLYDLLLKFNQSHKMFNLYYFKRELNRFWFHNSLKRIYRSRCFDMFLSKKTLFLINPFDLVYLIKFYLLKRMYEKYILFKFNLKKSYL